MVDKVQISTIRITSEIDASKHVQGAAEITAANKQIDASSKEVAATVSQTQQKVNQSGDVFGRLARQYIDGYGAAQKFQSALNQLTTGVERGNVTIAQAVPLLDGMYRKFGLLGDAASIAARGQTELAVAVQNANAQLIAQKQIETGGEGAAIDVRRFDELRAKFDTAGVAAERLQQEIDDLNEAIVRGINISGGYEARLEVIRSTFDGTAEATRKAQRETDVLASRISALTAEFNPAAAAVQKLEETMRRLAEAERLGVISAEQASARHQELIDDYVRLTSTTSATQAEFVRLSEKFDTAGTASMRMATAMAELNEALRLGVDITGGYEAAVERIRIAHDADYAATVRLREERERLIATARADNTAERSQVRVNQLAGVREPMARGSAEASMATFAPQFESAERTAALTTQFDTAGTAAALLQQKINDLNEAVARGVTITGGYEAALAKLKGQLTEAEQIARVTAYLDAQAAELEQLRTKFDTAGTSARAMEAAIEELNRAVARGVDVTGGYEAAVERIKRAHDADYDSAQRLKEEYLRLAAAGREAFAQDQANKQFVAGTLTPAPSGENFRGTAARSGSVFAERADEDEMMARSFDVAVREAARGEELMAQQAAELRAELDPAAAAVARMNEQIARYNVLLKAGEISQEEFTRGQALAQQQQIGSQAGRGGLGRFGAINAAAQLQDIAVTAAMGQSLTTIVLQQGTQLGQALETGSDAAKGFRGIMSGIGSAFTSLLSVTNLWALGITAVFAGVIIFGSKIISYFTGDVEAVMKRHEERIKEIKQLWSEADDEASKYSQGRQAGITFTAGQDIRDLTKQLTPQLGQLGFELFLGNVDYKTVYGDLADVVKRFSDEALEGKGDVLAFNAEIQRIATLDPSNTVLQDKVTYILELGTEATATAEAVKELNRELLATTMIQSRTRAAENQRRYVSENLAIQREVATQERLTLQGLNIRSPAEAAALARAQEEAKPVTGKESPETRRIKEDTAATLAYAEAEQELKDAQEDRDRSQLRSLATAQNNIDLVGKTVAEVEGLRLAYERQAEMEDTAARGHGQVDQAALARAKERAMVEGQRIAQAQALQKVVDQGRELEKLQAETQLVGINKQAHDAAMRTLENENEIRRLGLGLLDATAWRMRLLTALINAQIQVQQRAQLLDDVAFEHAQRNRSATEQAIRTRLRAAGEDEEDPNSEARREIAKGVAEERQRELDAQIRARQRSIEAAREEISLVGKTTTEVAALRYEYERIAALEEEAIQRNEQVDPAARAAAHAEAIQVGINAARLQATETIQSQKDQIELTRAEVATIGQGTLARQAAIETLKTEIAIRKLGTGATKEQTDALRENTAELNALAEASAKAQLAQDLLFETRQAGRSIEDRGIAEELRARGFDDSNLNSPEAQAIRQIEQIHRLQETWQELFDTVNDGIDSMVDTLFEGTGDWEEQLKKIGRQFARQMFDLALTNPLKNFLTGANENTIADLGIFGSGASSGRGGGFGGLLGQLTGAQKAVASMQVQAGTVIVNGGLLGGGTGLPGVAGGKDALGNIFPSAPDTLEDTGILKGGSGSDALVGSGADALTKASGRQTRMGIDLATIHTASGLTADVNAKYASQFQGIVDDLEKSGYKIKTLGGYNFRNIAGTRRLSEHAFGNAIDINAATNPDTGRGGPLITDMPAGVGGMAERRGLGWGGDWRTKKDAMHFEVQDANLASRTDTAAVALDKLGSAGNTAADSLNQAGLAGMETVKGLTDAAGGLTKFGGLLSSFMAPGGGSGAGWFQSLAGMLGGAGGAVNFMQGISPGATSAILAGGALGPAGLYHEGGIGGSPTSYRGVDSRMFIGARRYHNGGFAGDEVPAILRRGEPVFKSMDDARRMTQPANQNVDQLAAAVGKKLNINLKNINLFDPSVVGDYTRTEPGEQAMINMMRRTGTGRGL